MPDLDHTQILPNYNNFGYFYFELSEEQKAFFNHWNASLDTKALAVLNQYEFLRTFWGDNTVKDYLDLACKTIKNHPKFLNVICGKVYIQCLMSYSPAEVVDYIKERVCKALRLTLPKVDKYDLSCAEFILIYADSDLAITSMYEFMFGPESKHPLREVLSLTTLKRWCIKLLSKKVLSADQRNHILSSLKKMDLRHYNSFVAQDKIRAMSEEELKVFWTKTCTNCISEHSAKRTKMQRSEFVKQAHKLKFEGGFKEEFFRKLPQYLSGHDNYESGLFLNMCPSPDSKEETQDQIKRFQKLLDDYSLIPEEQYLLQNKIQHLKIALNLAKLNSSNQADVFAQTKLEMKQTTTEKK